MLALGQVSISRFADGEVARLIGLLKPPGVGLGRRHRCSSWPCPVACRENRTLGAGPARNWCRNGDDHLESVLDRPKVARLVRLRAIGLSFARGN